MRFWLGDERWVGLGDEDGLHETSVSQSIMMKDERLKYFEIEA